MAYTLAGLLLAFSVVNLRRASNDLARTSLTLPGGVPVVVSLGGDQTLRFNTESGDYDYFVLIPGSAQLRIGSIGFAGGDVTITWDDPAAVLQSSDTVDGTYADVAGATSPYTTPASGAGKYYRLMKP